jgi:hypothetical protein
VKHGSDEFAKIVPKDASPPCLRQVNTCSYPDNCPCFQDPDAAPPPASRLDQIVCDMVNLETRLRELGIDD